VIIGAKKIFYLEASSGMNNYRTLSQRTAVLMCMSTLQQ